MLSTATGPIIWSDPGSPRSAQHFEEWAEEDTYLPLDAELAALREIGFEAERVWNDGPVGVVVARKR